MLVSMWMTRDPVSVAPDATISAVAQAMARRRVRRMPVVRHGRLVGIVTSHDVARAYPPDLNPFSVVTLPPALDHAVSEVMTPNPRAVTPATPIEDAARLLREHKIGAVPVVSGDDLVGIITESDIFRAFLEMIGDRGAGVRMLFQARPEEDVVATALHVGTRHGMRLTTVLSLEHDDRHLVLIRLHGSQLGPCVEALQRTGHQILSVLRP